MCGITGVVDFRRDLDRDGCGIDAMTRSLRHRGPDEGAVWVAGGAAFGHRRLCVIDIVGGRQPMVDGAGDDVRAVLTYGGEVYNFAELRDELRGYGHRFSTRSDTEVVLRAYLQWDDDFPRHLNGMFACAVWDPRARRLLLVRDPLGVKPLYYHETSTGVVFGSEPKAVLAAPGARAIVDADGLRELLALTFTPGAAVYQGMRAVRPGEVVTITPDGVRRRRYWELTVTEPAASVGETVATVADLLRDTVDRQVVADVPLGTLLSGGLDSSIVTALAHASAGRPAGPLRTFSVDFTGYEDNFRPDFMRDAPDGPYVREMTEHLGTEHTNVLLSPASLSADDVRGGVLRAFDAPTGRGDRDLSMYRFFADVVRSTTVALSGEGADEVFGGYAWFHSLPTGGPTTFPWLRMFGLSDDGVDPAAAVLTDDAARTLDLTGYRAACFADAVAAVPRGPEAEPQRPHRVASHLAITRLLGMMLERKDRLSMAHGLEVRVPFCDHRLVQYVFNTSWETMTFDGREKSLLRAAARALLPASVLARRKAPYPAVQDGAYADGLARRVRTMLDDPDGGAAALIDRRRIQALLRRGDLHSNESRCALELAVGLHGWLTGTGVEVRLEG